MSRKKDDPSLLPLEERLSYVNRLRAWSLFRLVLYIVLASLFGVGGFVGLILSLVLDFDPEWAKWLTLSFSVAGWPFLMTVFIFLALAQKPRYQKAFYTLFASEAVKGVYGDFSLMYAPGGPRYREVLAGARSLVKKEPDLTAGSYYEGTFRGVRFASFAFPSTGLEGFHRGALAVEAEGGRRISSSSKWGSKELGGRYFSFLLPSVASVPLFIKDRRDLSTFRKTGREWKSFSSESIRFNEAYLSFYRGDDENAAYRALGPDLIRGLLALEDDFAGHFSLYLEKQEGRCLYNHYDSGLRLGLTKKATDDTLRYLREELLLPKRIIQALFLKEGRESKGQDE